MLALPLSEIKRIEAIAKNRKNCISLSQAALRIGGIPKEIKHHMQEILLTGLTDNYESAWGIMQLREKIAHHLNQKHHLSLTTKNIMITHGSVGALSTIFLGLLTPGDEVIIPEPAYPAYDILVKAARCTTKFVPCHSGLDLDAIKAATTPKTKLLVFSNPCNPSGYVVSKKILEELVSWCQEHDIFLIADEVYDDYLFSNSFHSTTPFVNTSTVVIRTGSFSKNFSMSGWRVGYMVVPHHLSQPLGRVQDALLNCPNVFAQYAALYALDHPQLVQQFQKTINQNATRVQQLLQPLVDLGFISYQAPQGGFNLFIKTHFRDTTALYTDIINEVGVSLIPGKAFGPHNNSFFRLCYARQPEILEEGIKRLTSFFESSIHRQEKAPITYALR